MNQQQTAFKNIVGKQEIARNEKFLLFPQCFELNQMTVSLFVHIYDITSLFAIELEEPKIDISGKGLIPCHSFDRNRQFNKYFLLQRGEILHLY